MAQDSVASLLYVPVASVHPFHYERRIHGSKGGVQNVDACAAMCVLLDKGPDLACDLFVFVEEELKCRFGHTRYSGDVQYDDGERTMHVRRSKETYRMAASVFLA